MELEIENNSETPKKNNVKKNYIYNLIYQLFLLIVPILVTPYLARVLLNDGQGDYAYTYSYVTYFTLFASLGFGYYAQRLIARDRTNKHKQSVDFHEINIARLIPGLLAIIIYFTLIFCNVFGEYKKLMLLHSFHLLAVIFDITYLLQGNEEFGKIAIRNVIIKSISIACIFIFIKTKEDLWIYVLIQSATILISNISLWLYLPKMIEKVKLSELHPLHHLLPTIVLFIPTIAISLYTQLDKTLIKVITGNSGLVGDYENAEKIVKMSITVIVSLVAVFSPRNTQLFESGKIDELKTNIFKLSKFVFLIGLPMLFGILAVSSNFLPWYLGAEYGEENIKNTIVVMNVLTPIIIIIGFGNVLGGALLIPIGMDIKYTLSITCGATTNILLNLVLIRYFGAIGAAIATVVAESVVTIMMLIFTRKYLNIFKVFISSYKAIIASIIMFVICFFLNQKLEPSILNTIIIIGTGIVTYAILIILLREKMVIDTITSIKNKICKKKN